MSRELLVHIGLPKTGTTSIQRLLFALRPRLAKAGILIPSAGRPPRLCCHNNVAHSLSGVPDYRPHLGGWREPSRFHGGLVAHFLRTIGVCVKGAALLRLPREHVRLGAKELAVRRLVNAAAMSGRLQRRERLARSR